MSLTLTELMLVLIPVLFKRNKLIILKIYVTLCGIRTVLSQSVHRTATYRCDDTRDCITQLCPPDDEHMCSKHVEAWNKLNITFSASSWLILINKYIEMHGQQNIKICSLIFIVSPCISIYLLVFTNVCTFIVIKILHKQSLM